MTNSMDGAAGARNPQAVLFACGFNSVRSPMAESLLQQMFPHALYVKSAGVRKGELDPFAVAVMAELGQDISGHKPMTFEELEDWEGLNFDLIITLSPEAHHKALELTHTLAADVEYWPTPDPTTLEGSREQKLRGLSRSLRRTDDAHPPAVCEGGRGERVATPAVVPACAIAHLARGPITTGRRHRNEMLQQPFHHNNAVTAYGSPVALRTRDDEDIEATSMTCSPVVECSPFR